MKPSGMTVGELADASGLTRRAVRFYVQQKLLDPPVGRGRGSLYEARHLDQLRRIIELQQSGHSLDAIRQLLSQTGPAKGRRRTVVAEQSALLSGVDEARPPPAVVRAELWTRLRIGDGIELSFDATKHNPPVERLLALRQSIREMLLPQE